MYQPANCTFTLFNYTISLEDSASGSILEQRVVSSVECGGEACEITFTSFNAFHDNGTYHVGIYVSQYVGQLSRSFLSHSIGKPAGNIKTETIILSYP